MKKFFFSSLCILITGNLWGNQLQQITPDFKKVKTSFDAKHTPKIEAPETVKAGEWFDVKVSIGAGAEHPSLVEHSVGWIAIFKNDVEISRIYLHPVFSKPQVTFTIALDESATLKVMEAPNHTAAWVATKKVKVIK